MKSEETVDIERELLEVWTYINDSLRTLEEVSDLVAQVYASINAGKDSEAFRLLREAIELL